MTPGRPLGETEQSQTVVGMVSKTNSPRQEQQGPAAQGGYVWAGRWGWMRRPTGRSWVSQEGFLERAFTGVPPGADWAKGTGSEWEAGRGQQACGDAGKQTRSRKSRPAGRSGGRSWDREEGLTCGISQDLGPGGPGGVGKLGRREAVEGGPLLCPAAPSPVICGFPCRQLSQSCPTGSTWRALAAWELVLGSGSEWGGSG